MADYTASNAAELAAAIAAANLSTDPVNTITLTASITLTADLPLIHPDPGSTLVIDGDGFTVSGNNDHRIFFADTGKLVLKDVTLADGYAEGGDGGAGSSGGGGGMGAGGALFVNATADVTLVNVAFADNAVKGGTGGQGVLATGGGGGGGLGGDGGSAGFFAADHDDFDDTPGLGVFGGGGGGGGFNGNGGAGGAAVGDQDGGNGGDGAALGQAEAGSGATRNGTGGTGGLDGGGGGGGGAGAILQEGGGGGGGGIDGSDTEDRAGANGGDFGGGGGGGGALFGGGDDEFDVGDGGFGGGGGGSGVVVAIFGGGQGGFGGGGGGESPLGLLGGEGGFGGGNGGSRLEDIDNAGVYAAGGGGGGAGFGGAIFVRDGGKLTIGTASLSDNSATGGEGGTSLTSSVVGESGQGAGTGLFLQGIGTLTFDPGAGQVATIADTIVDEQGLLASGYDTYIPRFSYDPGAWGVWKSGDGTLILSGNNAYVGETHVDAGRLQVDGSIAYSMTTRVSNGATLGGNGTTGDVVVEAGGILGAGNSAGRLSTGDLLLASGAIFDVEIGGTVAGVGGYDQIAALGSVALGNATLDLSLLSGFAPNFGDAFEIVDNNGADAVAGTFSGLAEGAEFVAAGRAFEISYKGGDGNDVVVTAIQAVITGTSGNDFVNATNTIFGELPATDAGDIISGKGGNDKLYGIGGNDEIYGDDGKDKLYGDDGDDYVSGGKGKDKLYGGSGVDTLDGGKGKDKLTGGGDADTFVFSTTLKKNVFDRVTDFEHGKDVFNLSQDVFKKLGPIGELRAEQFHVGKAKGDDAQVVYQKSKGLLIYDKNGSKSGGDKVFAKVDKGTTLHHDDFFVV
jgi:Ca2+-binding RTX toxin-like protein